MAEAMGTVVKIFRNTGSWCAGVLEFADCSSFGGQPSCKFAGACSLAEMDEVVLHGEWITDPKWGRQFKVTRALHLDDTPEDQEAQGKRALVSFLKSNKDLKHIGEKRAKLLVETFGGIEELGDALLRRPEQVVEKIPGLTEERVAILAAQWATSYLTMKYEVALVEFGLKPSQARSVVARFGKETLKVLEDNPWLVYLEVPEIPWTKVDQAALAKGFDPQHHYRVHALSVKACRDAARDGHTWISGDPRQLSNLSTTDAMLPHNYLMFIDRGEDEAPRYAQALYDLAEAEDRIALFLARAEDQEPHLDLFKNMLVVKDLTDEQHSALEDACRYRVFLLVGGAGTGKTYTAEALIDAYEGAGGRVILAAPTGKAAKRMMESTGRPAVTLHRMLLSQDGLAEFHDADLLVIDEVSMVDSMLLSWVLREIKPRTSLVMMGDPNQLPPVNAGNPLRDMLEADLVPHVELSRVHRCAGDLKDCCVRVLGGQVADNVPGVWEVETMAGGPSAHKALWKLLDRLEDEGYSFPDDIQVLTPMKKGVNGTFALNQALRDRHFGEETDLKVFREGDKVIQTKNDYALNVFNGELGTIIRTYPEDTKQLIVRVDNKVVSYAPYQDSRTGTTIYPINDLQYAYALTVHKTQGSEYPIVVLVLDNYHTRMLHRNLLYTAVTRAQQAVFIISTRGALATAAKTVIKDQRRTLLA